MLIPIFESFGYVDSYPLAAALEALATKALKDSVNLDLNLPYGDQELGFAAGMIGELTTEGGETVAKLSDNDAPLIIFADSFQDTLRSGKASFYYLAQGNKFKVKSNYDTAQTYVVGDRLTVIPSGDNQGKLTLASAYSSQGTVGVVIEAPASASNNDFMVILTDLQDA